MKSNLTKQELPSYEDLRIWFLEKYKGSKLKKFYLEIYFMYECQLNYEYDFFNYRFRLRFGSNYNKYAFYFKLHSLLENIFDLIELSYKTNSKIKSTSKIQLVFFDSIRELKKYKSPYIAISNDDIRNDVREFFIDLHIIMEYNSKENLYGYEEKMLFIRVIDFKNNPGERVEEIKLLQERINKDKTFEKTKKQTERNPIFFEALYRRYRTFKHRTKNTYFY